jgi:hypothetical protein
LGDSDSEAVAVDWEVEVGSEAGVEEGTSRANEGSWLGVGDGLSWTEDEVSEDATSADGD